MLLEIIIAAILIIIAVVFFLIYNSLITLNNNVKKAWANIDVLLQKRHDMLTKLIDSVSGYMKYEKGVMTNITQLRSAWESIPQDDVKAKIDTSNQITSALKTIFAVAENYPDLKADNNFIQLQQSIVSIENELADQREIYNNSVNDFNIKIQQFPSDIVASMMHYSAKPMFQVPEEEKQDVKISFDNV
ncbi:MAG: LemA family protein [Candidatus Micrarchaeia archaeon]